MGEKMNLFDLYLIVSMAFVATLTCMMNRWTGPHWKVVTVKALQYGSLLIGALVGAGRLGLVVIPA